MDRSIDGLINYHFDNLEELEKVEGMSFETKARLADRMIRTIWGGAQVNLAYKKMLVRAPDIAKSKDRGLTFNQQ